ncbi:MAG: hypothetical protein AABY86_03175 [Bdellovibrionota bacterium]
MIRNILLFLLILPTAAMADLWCAQSYRYENFSLGVAQGYRGGVARPKILDEMCFRLGVQYGQEIKKNEANNSRCDSAFNDGIEEGLRGTMGSHSPDSFTCFQAGNQYGLARLSLLARAGNVEEVGPDCVQAYLQGKKDGLNNRVATLPSEDKERTCYLTGHSDATFFGGIL